MLLKAGVPYDWGDLQSPPGEHSVQAEKYIASIVRHLFDLNSHSVAHKSREWQTSICRVLVLKQFSNKI